jgi:hypothetical protein
MLDAFTSDRNPLTSMNLHFAVRWILRSWNHCITNTTIYNCFRKSTLVSIPIARPIPITPPGINELYEQVIQAGNIHDVMAISNFLNPTDEEEDIQDGMPSEDEVLQEVIDEHLGLQQTQDDDEELQLERSSHSVKSARQALQVLIEFTEEQEALQTDYLRGLERLEFALEALDQGSRVQSTLDSML